MMAETGEEAVKGEEVVQVVRDLQVKTVGVEGHLELTAGMEVTYSWFFSSFVCVISCCSKDQVVTVEGNCFYPITTRTVLFCLSVFFSPSDLLFTLAR